MNTSTPENYYVKKWLEYHGDRDFDDLFKDEETGELYVFMSNGRKGYEKVYIPKTRKYTDFSSINVEKIVDNLGKNIEQSVNNS